MNMKKEFIFERNLPHQKRAVESIINVFNNLPIKIEKGSESNFINPIIDNSYHIYKNNILKLQEDNNISNEIKPTFSNIIDIMMETGTGKTYTYTKTIFELNKLYGIFKFIIIVPTLSIKAGTINFLKSDSAKKHFKEQYNKKISLHILESQKSKKKKLSMPIAISDFVNSEKSSKDTIQILLINTGMLNSDTLYKNFDTSLHDKYTKPIEALSSISPFVIIDEPHRFAKNNKTWQNIKLLNSQYIIRFGATFPEKEITIKNILGEKEKRKVKEYENLIYTLSAVDAFNQNLVKGVIGYVEEFKEGENVFVRLVNCNKDEAIFELVDNKHKEKFHITKKEELKKIHPNLTELFIEKMNKTEVLLSNGLSLKKGDKINPFSYNETLQEKMIKKAVENHFKLEKEFLTQSPRIKPLTLFFIDNIDEYRNKNGYLKKTVNEVIKAVAKKYLETEKDEFYRNYLQKTINNIELTHGGYFSQDKKESDEVIEKEINEILHDKEALLSLDNPRRFIFSKWTLKEGWDNPNVFQICKLRNSGSEISKLQEVGRGLRLPVNEYMARVKDKEFYLNYYVDFTENDFIDKLKNEINEKSNTISKEVVLEKLNDDLIKKILENYPDKFKNEEKLLEYLDEKNLITRSNSFKEGGFDYIKENFPLIFDGVDSTKIKKDSDKTEKIKVRTGKYSELKELWEELNKKAILEYKIENENEFKKLFKNFINLFKEEINEDRIRDKKIEIIIENKEAITKEVYLSREYINIPIITMTYHSFLKELAKEIKANPKTLNEVFKEIQKDFNINHYLNSTTIKEIKNRFNRFIFIHSINEFGISYQKISNSIHPTKLTDKNGNPLTEINASDVGTLHSNEKVAQKYYFEELFYDSELEKENITIDVDEVIVFTKIPKNSIKIPVAGGGSYSPDFAYVLKTKDGKQKLYFVLETKNVDSKENLRNEEIQKIKHAQKFFEAFGGKIKFETQFKDKKIVEIINKILKQ
jgi:type III restriction enzyme